MEPLDNSDFNTHQRVKWIELLTPAKSFVLESLPADGLTF
jgi:hypothetical protein